MTDDDGRHDFDFLHGTWTGHNRYLTKRLVGATEWREFPTTLKCWPLLGGLMMVDELTIPNRPGGVTVRSFNTETRQWNVYWITTGNIDPPVVGSFRDGVGEFYSDDTWEGTPIRVRYAWDSRDPKTPKWHQAFSVDGEKTWEINWFAEFTRIED